MRKMTKPTGEHLRPEAGRHPADPKRRPARLAYGRYETQRDQAPRGPFFERARPDHSALDQIRRSENRRETVTERVGAADLQRRRRHLLPDPDRLPLTPTPERFPDLRALC